MYLLCSVFHVVSVFKSAFNSIVIFSSAYRSVFSSGFKSAFSSDINTQFCGTMNNKTTNSALTLNGTFRFLCIVFLVVISAMQFVVISVVHLVVLYIVNI